jgi:hypothetical protein
MIIAFVLAAVSSIGTTLMWTGGLVWLYLEAPDFLAVLGERIIVFFPAVAGVALSVGNMDRKLGNPPGLWAAAIWNVVLVVGYLLVLALA